MTDQLEEQIAKARMEISADSISMSIGELTSLHNEGVLEIRPEFQRLFRWKIEQKSRLIESVLLGIPLPSIFVSQSESGKWELVDGLQRVSTLLELQGLLRAEDGTALPALRLTGTKFLEHLEEHTWTGENGTKALTDAQKLDIRLARLDLRVLKRNSDPKAKFDLFQRLNSFGSAATAQEVRSAMIASTNSAALAWLTAMARLPAFSECLRLSDRQLEEQYDIELVLRFCMLHDMELHGRKGLADFPSRLDDWAVDFATTFDGRYRTFEQRFTEVFRLLNAGGGGDIFRRWDGETREFKGPFLNTSFEIIALGLGFHIARGSAYRTDFLDVARSLSENNAILPERFATGLATADRFIKSIPIGREVMALKSERLA